MGLIKQECVGKVVRCWIEDNDWVEAFSRTSGHTVNNNNNSNINSSSIIMIIIIIKVDVVVFGLPLSCLNRMKNVSLCNYQC